MFQAKYDRAARDGVSVAQLHSIIRRDGDELAAGLDDLGVRARVYHQIYRDSNARFHFALIASHGALWARWYLLAARLAANIFAVGDVGAKTSRQHKMRVYSDYIDAIKEINRQVMIETFTSFYLYRVFGEAGCRELGFDDELTAQFCQRFSQLAEVSEPRPEDDRRFYESFFRWEQQRVVGPAVDDALELFEWPFMRSLCMRPWVWFSYFRPGRALIFKNFADQEERVSKGLIAYDWACAKGWPAIERNCRYNPFLSGEDRVAIKALSDGVAST